MGVKLPFPDKLLVTSVEVELFAEGLDEDGAPFVAAQWSGKCIFSEKTKTTKTPDGKVVRLEGSVILKGDIAPEQISLSDGKVVINQKTYSIYRASRPRNPDGTVHHTTLELM